MQAKPNYTKEEVEEIVSGIIHQDSFGDVHHKAHKMATELNMNFSPERFLPKNKKWRTLVRVTHIGDKRLTVIVPAWDPGFEIELSKDQLPPNFCDFISMSRCFARVNIEAEGLDYLEFSDWENATI